MVRLDANQWHLQSYRDEAYQLTDLGVAGFGVFLGQVDTTAEMIEQLQRRAGGKLLIAADYEYGLPMRLDGGVSYPRAMALGVCSEETTQNIAALIAHEASAIGVNWNWAPVADINSNPLNPIINTRSFGETPEVVARHVQAFIRGTQERGVLACAKHFPGHGDTNIDSHVDLPTIHLDQAVAMQRELVPFRAAVDAGVASMMVGHIVVPFLDPERPASLSSQAVQNLLRTTMGFQGLVCTDALDMHAISDRYPSGEAAVMAIEAGVDIALMPDHTHDAIDALAAAMESGRLSESLLASADQRLHTARLQIAGGASDMGHRCTPVVVDQSTHALFALKAASQAVRIVGDDSTLPITQFKHVAALAAISEADMDTATTWFQGLTQAVEQNIDCGYIDGTMSDAELNDLADGLQDADVILLALFGRAVAYRGSLPGAERLPHIIDRLAGGRPVIVVACGSPYGVENITSTATLYTYSDTLPSVAASVMKLIGRVVC